MNRRALPICLVVGACFCGAQSDPKESGSTSLLIAYRCDPSHRVELRQLMREKGLARFEQWKDQGILADYRILFSRYVDTNNWDMLAYLQFKDFTAVAKWDAIERATPAGLPAEALRLTSTITTWPSDLMRQKGSDTPSSRPVYLVIPYAYSVPPQTYLQYADDYVRPQFEGWMREGILSSYRIFVQRYTAARPWDSLILLEYKDDDSLGSRERIVAKVRQELQGNPVWKAISDGKQNVRVEKEAVIAEELRINR